MYKKFQTTLNETRSHDTRSVTFEVRALEISQVKPNSQFVLGVSGCLKSTRDLSSQQSLPPVVSREFVLVLKQASAEERDSQIPNITVNT